MKKENEKGHLKVFLRLIPLFFLFLNGCEKVVQPPPIITPTYEIIITGSLSGTDIREASGIVRSNANPGYYWVHNDSDDEARVFLIDSTGKVVTTVFLDGVENRDWEDISCYKDPNGKNYIYLADIGDNALQYKYKNIYRFEEPSVIASPSTDIHLATIDILTFRFADVNRDCETMLVDPLDGEINIISKWEEKVALYTFSKDFDWKDTLVVAKTGDLPFGGIVSGDVSSNKEEILLKSYSKIYYWKRDSNSSLSSTLLNPPIELQYKAESQGEAICWASNGKDFYTVTECKIGAPCDISFYKKKK